MSITRLALQNFRKSVSTYLSLILSLAFTIMIIYNFQCIVFSDLFDTLEEPNKGYINVIYGIPQMCS